MGSGRRGETKGRQNVVKVCFWADNLKLRRHTITARRRSCADNERGRGREGGGGREGGRARAWTVGYISG